MRNKRGQPIASRSYNKYPSAPDADGRGASTVTRAKPVGKDPLAVEEGKNDTLASQEYLAAQRARVIQR